MFEKDFVEFNTEMARLKEVTWQGYAKTLKEVGIAYLGNVSQSVKLRHSEEYSLVNTYGIYLSPDSELSGYTVCPNNQYCKDNCLSGSGHNKIERLTNLTMIDKARITKTRLFFANKNIFMQLLIHEVNVQKRRAELKGHFFAIRLNCTSDISPLAFVYEGKNILEIFPDCIFYDYTKVPNRFNLLQIYPNYDITWSIDGSQQNLEFGLDYLEQGGRVAVVYGEDTMPILWHGYNTCDGDLTDYRPNDSEQVCMLKFKKTANNYINGKFVLPNTDFIVTKKTPNVKW